VHHDLCKHCYKKVFFYRNEFGSVVVFDRLGAPWPRHACYQTGMAGVDHSRKTVKKIKKPSPYDITVLERRHAELLEKRKKRDRAKQLKKERKEAEKLARAEARKAAKAKQKLSAKEAKKAKAKERGEVHASNSSVSKTPKKYRRRRKSVALGADKGLEERRKRALEKLRLKREAGGLEEAEKRVREQQRSKSRMANVIVEVRGKGS